MKQGDVTKAVRLSKLFIGLYEFTTLKVTKQKTYEYKKFFKLPLFSKSSAQEAGDDLIFFKKYVNVQNIKLFKTAKGIACIVTIMFAISCFYFGMIYITPHEIRYSSKILSKSKCPLRMRQYFYCWIGKRIYRN